MEMGMGMARNVCCLLCTAWRHVVRWPNVPEGLATIQNHVMFLVVLKLSPGDAQSTKIGNKYFLSNKASNDVYFCSSVLWPPDNQDYSFQQQPVFFSIHMKYRGWDAGISPGDSQDQAIQCCKMLLCLCSQVIFDLWANVWADFLQHFRHCVTTMNFEMKLDKKVLENPRSASLFTWGIWG